MIQRMYPQAVARRQNDQELERKLKQDKLKLEATDHLQQILLPGNLRPSSSSLTQVKNTRKSSLST
jgi:flagellar basal body-associated protein FliL